MSGLANCFLQLFKPKLSPPHPLPAAPRIITYKEDFTTAFSNPERGLYSTSAISNRVPAAPWGSSSLMTLQIKEFTLPTNSGPLPDSFLAEVDKELSVFYNSDIKVIILFAYTYVANGEDAPVDIVIKHIEQLGPILNKHKGVIALTHAGFAGAWGEWGYHRSTNDLVLGPNKTGKWRGMIKDALLGHFPGMIAFRRPNFIGPANLDDSYNFGDWFSHVPLSSIRFNGGPQSRVALYNDCFLDGATNGSWYDDYDGTTTSQDKLIAMTVTRITPAGGETCEAGGLNEYTTGKSAILEMTASHWDYLNASYWNKIYESWSPEIRSEIVRKLGYRYVLKSASIPASAESILKMQLVVENVGFGKLYNPRPLKIVLVGDVTYEIAALTDCRVRMPLAQSEATLNLVVPISSVNPGTYSLHLVMPDDNIDRVGCKIRFANIDTWDSTTGYNNLHAKITIT